MACFAALVAVGVAAAFSSTVQTLDVNAAAGFTAAASTRLGNLTARIARLGDEGPYLLLGVTLVGVALLRRRPARALAVALLFAVTGITTQLLKTALGHPRIAAHLGVDLGSWPSGHSTAAMTVALCAVLVAPRVLRPAAVVVGGAFALAVGLGVLVMRWHLTTDVAGGYLVATAWTLVAVAVLKRVEKPRPAIVPAFAGRWVAGAVVAALGLGAAHVASGNADALASYAQDHTIAAAAAAGLSVLALTLAASLAATLRR
jgi:membrane-associated phospholipid phosphatase